AAIVGESTRESALPWDQINGTIYPTQSKLDPLIGQLTANFEQRLQISPDLDYLVKGIEASEAQRARKSVSLNLDTRRVERETLQNERLARENSRRKALGLEPVADLEALDADDEPDILLDEAAAVATDMAVLRQNPASPPRTAQNRQ
ncbi:MAG: carboxy terminal-processing peptidase, partial [Pseudomonadota bacterium]